MKKTILTLSFIALALGINLQAQVTNFSLRFNVNSSINCGVIPELDNAEAFTIQFWVNAADWNSGAAIYSRGEGANTLSCKLSGTNELLFQLGAQSFTVSSGKLTANRWTHVMLKVNKGAVQVYLDNVTAKSITFSGLVIPASSSPLVLGNNFTGRIDEFRVWGLALPDSNYYLWKNTLNKYHPNWNNLILYYKFDQDLCADNVVDYTFKHHADFSGNVVREPVTDNANFVYRINSAYTDLGRWSDRKVDKEKYLMANDIIMLGVESYSDGSIDIPLPINDGTTTNCEYIDEFDGRTGVLQFNGVGAKMDVGTKALDNKSEEYTFYTWMYIDEWVEGAFLFKKEASDTQGFSIRLGTADSKEIIVRLNGSEYKRALPKADNFIKTWYHIAIASNRNAASPDDWFQFMYGERSNRGARDYPTTNPSTLLPQGVHSTSAVVGLNFKGKLDETAIWKKSLDHTTNLHYMTWVPFPSNTVALDPPSVTFKMNSMWTYDDPENVGYDMYSYKNIMKQVESNYANHRGYKLRMSVKGHDGWQNTFANSVKRKRLAKGIVEIAKQFDGIDLDFEWCSGNTYCWQNYGKLVDEIVALMPEEKVFSVSPHGFDYGLPKSSMSGVDFFTFQIYGPQKDWYTWSKFEQSYNNFVNYGYPKDKILMSYAAITSSPYEGGTAVGQPVGVGFFATDGYSPEMDSYTDENGRTWYVTGVNQTRKRADFMQDKGCAGIFYWDMGNDIATSHPYSLARVSNFAIASNVDTIVRSVTKTGLFDKIYKTQPTLTVYPNPTTDYIKLMLPNGNNQQEKLDITILSNSGQVLKSITTYGEQPISVSDLLQGVYILRAKSKDGTIFRQTFIKKK